MSYHICDENGVFIGYWHSTLLIGQAVDTNKGRRVVVERETCQGGIYYYTRALAR